MHRRDQRREPRPAVLRRLQRPHWHLVLGPLHGLRVPSQYVASSCVHNAPKTIADLGLFLVEPAKYDFAGTRAIAVYDDDSTTVDTASERGQEKSGSASPVEKASPEDLEGAKDDITTEVIVVEETENGKEEPVTRAELKKVFKRAAWYSLALTVAVAILGESSFAHLSVVRVRGR